jgi:hypothetical protein
VVDSPQAGPTARRAAAVLALALLALPLVPLRRGADPALWQALADAAHFPLLVAFTLVLYHAAARVLPGRGRRALLVAAAGLLGSLAIEWIQPRLGRTASLRDLAIATLGIAAALAGVAAWSSGSAAARWVHGLVTLALFAGLLLPAAVEWRAIAARGRSFPMLADFEQPIELRLWRARGAPPAAPTRMSRSTSHASSGRFSLEVVTGGGEWPGVSFAAGGSDWRGHAALSFDVFNPGPSFPLSVRIDDAGDTTEYASRFNRTVTIAPGANRIRIPTDDIRQGPRDRELELGDVRWVMFFVDAGAERRFYLDRVQLEGPSDRALAGPGSGV